MMALDLQILKSELMDLFATLQRAKSFLILDSRAIHHETWPYLVLAFQLQLQSRKSSVLHFPWSHGQQERLRSWGCHFHHAFMPCQLILSKYWHRKLYETVMSTCNSRKQSEIHSGSSHWIFIWNFHYALFSIQKVWPPFPNETITRIGTWWYQSTGFLTWLAIPSTSHFYVAAANCCDFGSEINKVRNPDQERYCFSFFFYNMCNDVQQIIRIRIL